MSPWQLIFQKSSTQDFIIPVTSFSIFGTNSKHNNCFLLLASSLKSWYHCIASGSGCFCGFLILHEETLYFTFVLFFLCWHREHSLLPLFPLHTYTHTQTHTHPHTHTQKKKIQYNFFVQQAQIQIWTRKSFAIVMRRKFFAD